MSRKAKKRPQRGVTTIERANAPSGGRQPNIRPGGANFRPVTDAVVNQMYQHLAPQSNQGYMYVPGAPIKPVLGLTPPGGPRQYEYPIGYNIAQLPRSTEAYSFSDLRSLASMYYGIQICQQVWFDYISKLELVIEPRPDLIEKDRDISEYLDDIDAYREFFSYPDRERDLHSWLQMAVRDQLEIDAVAIYVRKDRLGRPYALELLDGSTIKPLINDRGRRPDPGFPSYEQFVYGVPACFLTSDDLIYIKETERTDSVYGISRVEKIILNTNVALRKQTKDLARFTDGTVPQGVLQPSMDVQWSQEEIEAYEIQFNNLMAGSDEQRARVKVLPRGFEYKPTDDPDIHVDLDTFLLNITASTYGLTMSELAFTQDVNRSTGEMQENVVYRRAMGPLMTRYAKLFTGIIRKYFKDNRFVVRFAGFGEVEDFRARAEAYSTLVGAGILSPSRAAHELNLPVDVDVNTPLLPTKSGPMPLSVFADPKVVEAQKQALIEASKPPAPPAAPKPGAGEEEEEEEGQENAPGGKGKPQQQKKQPARQNEQPQKKKETTKPLAGGKARRADDDDELLLRVARALAEVETLLAEKKHKPPEDEETVDDLEQEEEDEQQADEDELHRSDDDEGDTNEIGDNDSDLGDDAEEEGEPFESRTQQNTESVQAGADTRAGDWTPRTGKGAPAPASALVEGRDPGAYQAKETATVSAEYRRWRKRALDDIKAGKGVMRGFTTTLIPAVVHVRISQALAKCRSVEEVRAVFERSRDEEQRMVSRMGSCQCETCRAHHGQPVGDEKPPYHEGCGCSIEPEKEK